jgi:DNA-binding Xre family transcriptional regulator
MTRIQEAAQRLIDKYGSRRKAAAASGISHSLLHKLASGEKSNPTADTLVKLGLEIRHTYIRKVSAP